MCRYLIKKTNDLLPAEITAILQAWDEEEWQDLSPTAFKALFHTSEFHLLKDDAIGIVSVARINFDFKLAISGQLFSIPEFVGFVSMQKGKGYGTALLHHIITNLHTRNIEALGFCEKALRPFYEKCAVPILYNQAQFIVEQTNNEWQPGTDDDILNLTLFPNTVKLLESLTVNRPAFLVNESGS